METLKIILTILLAIISVGLIVIVLMQEGKEGGLGAVAGAAGESYVSRNQNHTPEGKKRLVTRILGGAFMVVALAIYIISGVA